MKRWLKYRYDWLFPQPPPSQLDSNPALPSYSLLRNRHAHIQNII